MMNHRLTRLFAALLAAILLTTLAAPAFALDLNTGYLEIEYMDFSGNLIDREVRAITGGTYVQGKGISGYVLSTSDQYVLVQNGRCIPSIVVFWYTPRQQVIVTNPPIVTSAPWQGGYDYGESPFASSVSEILAAECYPYSAYVEQTDKSTNSQTLVELNDTTLGKLTDGSRTTQYTYTIWRSLREDDMPDLTYNFSNVSMRYVWICAGDQTKSSNYYANARASEVEVWVYCDQGVVMASRTLTDSYRAELSGYQCIDLGTQCTNVWLVEFYFRTYNYGSSNKNNAVIGDIICN